MMQWVKQSEQHQDKTNIATKKNTTEQIHLAMHHLPHGHVVGKFITIGCFIVFF